ncbi:hypothetical protein D3C84_805550 [compost metagenome]
MEPALGPGLAIVDFVRVQHHRPAGQAVAPGAAVLVTLHAGQGVTDGVGVVAVQVVAVTCKKRFETLQAGNVGCAVEPVIARRVSGHGDRYLELDAEHVSSVTGRLSAGGWKVSRE